MSLETFLEGLRQGWGNQFSQSIREVGFESLLDAADLTEDEVRNVLKASLEKAGALPLHILKICKGMVKAACQPTQNIAALELVPAAALPRLPQDVGIYMPADLFALIPPNVSSTKRLIWSVKNFQEVAGRCTTADSGSKAEETFCFRYESLCFDFN